MSARFTDYFLLITLSAMFGASFLLIKISVAEIPVFTLVALRLLIAAMVLSLSMKMASQAFPRGARIWFWILFTAVFGNALPWGLITWGQERVDVGLTAILMAIMPLSTVLLAHVLTRDEKLNRWKLLGVALGILGVVVLIGLEKLTSLGDDTIRQYAIATAAVCYGVTAIATKKLVGYPRRAMAATLMIVSFIIVAPLALIFDQPWTLIPSFNTAMSVVLLGIFPSALGTLMIFAIIGRQGASFLSQINFMVPLFGIIWGYLFLSERLSDNAAAAMVIILIGVAVARINPDVIKRNPTRDSLERESSKP